jgi:hypothetical protein
VSQVIKRLEQESVDNEDLRVKLHQLKTNLSNVVTPMTPYDLPVVLEAWGYHPYTSPRKASL